MVNELTKFDVSVLKFERKVRTVAMYPFELIATIFDKITDFFIWLKSCINWCIARSLGRWVGPIPTIISFTYMLIMSPSNGGTIELFFVMMFVSMVLLIVTLLSWLYIPYNEWKILYGKEEK